ncbi:receptor-like protein 33 [Ziziphus jujuba]|uniref:Receptor-like protein 33 n=1 Tax=Ziziphus jujuba TaxID=326968 RepID=A0A6P6FYC7_ZIZJJ|nr:receptor-like protein 33 [Ziziphus jujuba]
MVSISWLYFLIFLYLSLSSISSPSPSASFPLCHPDDSSALLQFKNSFSIDMVYTPYHGRSCGAIPSKTISWDENGTKDCCVWSGVTCDNRTGHVIGLDLTCSSLKGVIHSNSSLFFLRHLRSLILSYNDFWGSTISSEFGKLTHLVHLEIFESGFSGYFPPEFSYLSELVSLVLSSNDELILDTFTLKRIFSNLTSLEELYLFQVDMTSVEPVSLMNLSSSMTSLTLDFCNLQGNLPDNIFYQWPNLEKLSLEANENLTSFLTKTNWSSPLKYLDLSFTEFSIDLPHLTKSMKSLETLLLSNCKILGWNPTLLLNLTQMTSLDFSFNNFGGQVPWSFLNLKHLTYLRFQFNNFTGQLPDIYAHNSSQISFSSDSSKNQSLGPLPLYLECISLDGNLLDGKIPHWIYSLQLLQILTLSDNQFTGQIDEFKSRSLKELDLSHNKLHGPIPRSIFQQVNLTWLDLSSNNLSGVVGLDEFSRLQNLVCLQLSFNSLSLSSEISFNYTLRRLTLLHLSSCNITRFPNFIRNSKHLLELDISSNHIDGPVPNWLWNIGKDSLFYLNFSHNFLTRMEQLPWKQLQYLDLQFNLLEGQLPIPSSSIVVFLISNNQLSGEIPSLICNLSFLEVLDLSNNVLDGKIPPCIGNFSYSLSVLNLGMNKLHGRISATFAMGNSLRNLNLNGNQLEGLLPPSLQNCKKLVVLDLGNNKINDTFPYWLESLPVLQVLILRSNRFHGFIGSSKTELSFRKLRIIDLSNNEFSADLPAKYFENFLAMIDAPPEKLKYMGESYYQDSVVIAIKGFDIKVARILNIFTTIDMSNNNITGEIPKLIGKLKAFKGLNLSHNKLSGSIPPSFRNLINLEWLDLSSNELAGEIPQQLTEITFLEVLNLSDNRLVGRIPRGRQFDTFDNTSYSDNLKLCGFPLSKTCNNTSDEAEQSSPKSFQNFGDLEQRNGFNWKHMVLMGYGCGLVLGISVGYIVLFNKQPDCFTKIVIKYWRRMMG